MTEEGHELQILDGTTNSQLYTKLLVIYLYQNNLHNAKYLWKSIAQRVHRSSRKLHVRI